jgi:hypothetical protein
MAVQALLSHMAGWTAGLPESYAIRRFLSV